MTGLGYIVAHTYACTSLDSEQNRATRVRQSQLSQLEHICIAFTLAHFHLQTRVAAEQRLPLFSFAAALRLYGKGKALGCGCVQEKKGWKLNDTRISAGYVCVCV